MTNFRIRLTAVAMIALAAAASGCGFGGGPRASTDADLLVTRDFGGRVLLEAPIPAPPESETVIRALDREANVETRYGGGFVQAIDGLSAGRNGGRSMDWFFYVNGIESPVGSAEVQVHGGDRVWWDYRDWTDVMSVPAVVGAYPEPFLHGSDGKSFPVRIDCLGDNSSCQEVLTRLGDEDVPASLAFDRARVGDEVIRVIVGTWEQVASDEAAGLIDGGPSASGVFAGFEPNADAWDLVGLGVDGSERERYGAGVGLVAAVRLPDQQPAWVITGTDQQGVQNAVEALDRSILANHFAVAVPSVGEVVTLPIGDRP